MPSQAAVRKPLGLLVGWLLVALVSGGCRADPSDLADGEYLLLQSSSSPDIWYDEESPPVATAVIADNRFTIIADGVETTFLLGEEGDSYRLCPADDGHPVLLHKAVIVVDVALATPAAFGSCDPDAGDLSLVDIESFDEGKGFTRWLWFCAPDSLCRGDGPLIRPSSSGDFLSPHIPPPSTP